MRDDESASEKRIVEELTFGAKTSKRVGWEAWEFSVAGPHQIEVTNASWGFEKDDHSYIVGVEDHDGVPVPAECECKADRYNEEYDCKHKVALASIGGPVVLQAAIKSTTPGVDTERSDTKTMADQLRTDGGSLTDETQPKSHPLNEGEHSNCDCSDLPDGFPCADCYIEGRKDLPR